MITYKDLEERYKEIDRLPYSTRKVSLLHDLINYMYYYSYDYETGLGAFPSEIITNIDLGYRRNYMFESDKKKATKTYEDTPIFDSIVDEIITDLHENGAPILLYPRVNKSKMDEYIKDFFASISDDLYKHYKELKSLGLIKPIKGYILNAGGYTYPVNEGLSPIVYGEDNDFYDYLMIAHEMGHSYYHRRVNTTSKFNCTYALTEVPSTTLEYLFTKYITDNRLMNDKSLETININGKLAFLRNLKAYYMYKELDRMRKETDYLDEESIIEDLNLEVSPTIKVSPLEINKGSKLYSIGDIIGTYYESLFDGSNNKEVLEDLINFLMVYERSNIDDVISSISLEPSKEKLKSLKWSK